MTDDAKVPLPVPDDSNEWSVPLWDEDSLRAYGDARERAARAAAFDDAVDSIPVDPAGWSLIAGEMTAQEWRTVSAVVRHIRDDLRKRARAEGK